VPARSSIPGNPLRMARSSYDLGCLPVSLAQGQHQATPHQCNISLLEEWNINVLSCAFRIRHQDGGRW
jgi:hypothetical protein